MSMTMLTLLVRRCMPRNQAYSEPMVLRNFSDQKDEDSSKADKPASEDATNNASDAQKKAEAKMKMKAEAEKKKNAAFEGKLKLFRHCLYKQLKPQEVCANRKVSVVGTGTVGVACVVAMLTKRITNNVALYDINEKICGAERLDLLHGAIFLNNANIEACGKMDTTKDSHVVVITAGSRPPPNGTRMDVAQKTADVIKKIMPPLVELSPNAVFIIVSNPADVMAWLARKITKLPYERCFSSGCHLDSARLRMFVAKRLHVAPRSVHGFVIGEHGATCVPLWSTLTVGGVRLQQMLATIGTQKDPLKFSELHKDVIEAGFKVVAVKGYTNWAIGLTVADIVDAIFENSGRICSVSTNVKGMYGIEDEIFLSMPCVIRKGGLSSVFRLPLSSWEQKMLLKSAEELKLAQCSIKI